MYGHGYIITYSILVYGADGKWHTGCGVPRLYERADRAKSALAQVALPPGRPPQDRARLRVIPVEVRYRLPRPIMDFVNRLFKRDQG